MRFAEPQILYWLWALLPFIGLLLLSYRYRKRALARFAAADLSAVLAAGFSKRRYVSKDILFVLAFILAVVALARPQWGFEWQEVKRQGLDILLVIRL